MRYYFADCELDTTNALLHRAGTSVRLSRQVYKVLTYLLEHRGRLVSKDELSERVWQRVIADTAIEGCIRKVRKAVGDTGRTQRVITTRFGFGYAFEAPVVVCSQETAEALLPLPTPFHSSIWLYLPGRIRTVSASRRPSLCSGRGNQAPDVTKFCSSQYCKVL